jgi:hypothetical protein
MKDRQVLSKLYLAIGLAFAACSGIAAESASMNADDCEAEARRQDTEWGRQYREQAQCHVATSDSCRNPAEDARFNDWIQRIDELRSTCDQLRRSAAAKGREEVRQQALREYPSKVVQFPAPVITPRFEVDPARPEAIPEPAQVEVQTIAAPALEPSSNTSSGASATVDTDSGADSTSTQSAPSTPGPPPRDNLQSHQIREADAVRIDETPVPIPVSKPANENAAAMVVSPGLAKYCQRVRDGEVKYRFFWRNAEGQSCYASGNESKRDDIKCCPET